MGVSNVRRDKSGTPIGTDRGIVIIGETGLIIGDEGILCAFFASSNRSSVIGAPFLS